MTTRLVQFCLSLLAVSFFVYVLIGLMPGDPVDLMIAGNPHMTPEDAARLRSLYGIDRPLVLRYGQWLLSTLSGDLGYSRLYGLPVTDIVFPRMLATLFLLGTGLFFTLLLAVPLGVYAARHKDSCIDRAISVFCLAGISLPSFWVGLLLISLFAVTLGWLPAGADLSGGGSYLKSMILPVATVVIGSLAVYIRHLRRTMIDALEAPHIRTARAKGCSDTRTVWGHAFRNAAVPVITLLMLDIGTLMGGAVTIETVFAWPGMGRLMFDAVMGNDYNLALCGFLILAAFVLAANMLADAVYRKIDPRQEKKA